MTTDPRNIRIQDYGYDLPDERIAKFPLAERDQSKLLVYEDGQVSERRFCEVPELLPEGALMVMNNTRVIQARLFFYKETGARVEILVLEPAEPKEYQVNFARRGQTSWYCMVGGLKKWKQGPLKAKVEMNGETIEVKAVLVGMRHAAPANEATATDMDDDGVSDASRRVPIVEFTWDERYTWSEILEAMGELPIPPYLNRKTVESDKRTYQTVYSKIEGSVAAPTAGLHFTERVLQALDRNGIEREEVTLHVGAGTFRPVKSEDIGHHDMHTEHFAVKRSTLEALLRHGGHAIAVGTTSVRTLESLYWLGRKALPHPLPCKEGSSYEHTAQEPNVFHVSQWEPYEAEPSTLLPTREGSGGGSVEALEALLSYMDAHGLDVLHASTQIIIVPGYRYRIVDRMITNFHQPNSTLLLLVAAFIGDDWRRVYQYAMEHDFRFLSYGDSSILTKRSGAEEQEQPQ